MIPGLPNSLAAFRHPNHLTAAGVPDALRRTGNPRHLAASRTGLPCGNPLWASVRPCDRTARLGRIRAIALRQLRHRLSAIAASTFRRMRSARSFRNVPRDSRPALRPAADRAPALEIDQPLQPDRFRRDSEDSTFDVPGRSLRKDRNMAFRIIPIETKVWGFDTLTVASTEGTSIPTRRPDSALRRSKPSVRNARVDLSTSHRL